MKKILSAFLLIAGAALVLASCKKDEQRAMLNTSAGGTTLSATPSSALVLDSTQKSATAITFSWAPLSLGYDAVITYTLQIDSIKDNFTKPVNIVVGQSLSKAYTVADFNNLVLQLGVPAATSGKVHARIKADVNQSSGSASSVASSYSNVVDVTVTPYSTKPKPKYAVPDSLYIVGDATPSSWSNPVATPSQKFTKVDENTFAMILQLTGGKHYLLLPKNGDWGHKYAAMSNTADPAGGAFQVDNGSDINGPAADGLYKIVVDFLSGTYTVTPAVAGTIPANLYIVGDATAGQWNNPVPVPSQQFTRISNGEFQLTLPLTAGKSYLFLPLNGDWGHKYGGTSKTSGTLLADGAVPGSNTPAPDASGTYKINVNFFAKTYTVSQ